MTNAEQLFKYLEDRNIKSASDMLCNIFIQDCENCPVTDICCESDKASGFRKWMESENRAK